MLLSNNVTIAELSLHLLSAYQFLKVTWNINLNQTKTTKQIFLGHQKTPYYAKEQAWINKRACPVSLSWRSNFWFSFQPAFFVNFIFHKWLSSSHWSNFAQGLPKVWICARNFSIPEMIILQHTIVFLPGESHEQRSLADYSPYGCSVRHDWSNLACPAKYTFTQRKQHIFIR